MDASKRAYVCLYKIHKILHDAGEYLKLLCVRCDVARFVWRSLGVIDPRHVGLAEVVRMNPCGCTLSLRNMVSVFDLTPEIGLTLSA
jgi:hypothetical protein